MLIGLLLLALSVFGQIDPDFEDYLQNEHENLPVVGELLYNAATLSGYRFGGGSGATKQTVDADSTVPFGKAMQLSIPAAGENPWEPQLETPVNAIDVDEDDILFYIFYTRALEASTEDSTGQGLFYVQRSESPWTGLGSQSLTIRSEWHKTYVIATAGEDYPSGEMEATFHLGSIPQTVEIGGIIALNLGPDVNPENLPTTPIYYDGMEADAAWRAEAAARIEQVRKGDLTVIIKNMNGQPIQGAEIRIEMQNHAYGFGTFMSELALSNSDDAENYKSEVLKLFNCATTPFYMGSDGWGWYHSEQNRQNYTNLAGWLQDHNIPTKGHVLIWPGWDWMPQSIQDLENDPIGLQTTIENHLDWVVPIGKEKGLIQWDVVNEPHINHDVMDILGDEILIDWYNQVHDLHPDARLILNEYNILMGGGDESFQDDFDYYISLLLEGGAPLGGIGMQCHFDANVPSIPHVLEILDRFALHGLPIQITEFDIDILDTESQAAYTRDFFTAVFSHPATDKIVMWGFWEGEQWKPNGSMIRTDWTYKPNYHIYNDLVFDQWWTDEIGSSNENGIYTTRGFLGDYVVHVTFDAYETQQNIFVTPDWATVEIQLASTKTIVEDVETYILKQNYPNPFNNTTIIEIASQQTGQAELIIYNARGEQVLSKVINVEVDFLYREEISFNNLAAGTYYYSVKLPDGSQPNRKMILVK